MNRVPTENLNIAHYLTVISRRRWFIILPFCLVMIAGIALAFILPKRYEATTLILVQPQQMPKNIITPVVSTQDFVSRVNTLAVQIMSRSHIERVATKLKIFGEQEPGTKLDDDKIEYLRGKIKVEVGRTPDNRETNSFTISVTDEVPETAMRLANGLSESFIEEYMRVREDQAVGTTDFLEVELKTMRKRLEEVEKTIQDFRERNKGMLPEELETNLRMLDSLMAKLDKKEENLRSARASLMAYDTDTEARIGALKLSKEDEERNPGKLREKLAEMMLKYTEQHPDIIRLKAAIEKLEADLPAKPGSKNPLSPSGGSISSAEETVIGNMYTRQRVELKQAIKALEGDIAKIKGEIAVYQARVEEAPTLSQEILILQRDYDNMRQSYHSLLNRRLEAEIAANMEKKQKGEQFIIIDEARMPKLPVSPKMPKLFLATVAGGFFLGGVLVFLIETIDLSVRRIDMLESEIGLPVLTMVPQIFTSKERRRHRMAMAATTLSILVAIALTGAFAMLVFLGFEPTLELIGYYLEA